MHNAIYSIDKHYADKQETSLVDCGANGGMASDDVMVIERAKPNCSRPPDLHNGCIGTV